MCVRPTSRDRAVTNWTDDESIGVTMPDGVVIATKNHDVGGYDVQVRPALNGDNTEPEPGTEAAAIVRLELANGGFAIIEVHGPHRERIEREARA